MNKSLGLGVGGRQGHSGEPGLLRKLVTSTGSIAPPWQPQAALEEEGPDEVGTGGKGAGLHCWVTDSPQEAREPAPHPTAVVEVERKGVGRGSQVTLGFYGERPENQANGREGGATLREGTRRRKVCKQFLVCVSS